MGSLKPLEKMADDVKQGDLVRIFSKKSDYVGYRWDLDKSVVNSQLMLPEDFDILFCGLNPYGVTRMEGDHITVNKGHYTTSRDGPIATKKIQYVGVNLRTRMLGNEPISGYEVIERTQYEEAF